MRALRYFMAAAAMAAVFGPATASAYSWPPPPVTLRPVASGFTEPVDIANARDLSRRLFVVEKNGVVRIVKDGVTNPVPFLFMTAEVDNTGERGMKAIAFDPAFRTNRRFFVSYNRLSDGALQVSSFLASAANPDVADPATRTDIITIQMFGERIGGHIAFGPPQMVQAGSPEWKRFLWITTGDGGPTGEGFPQNPVDWRGKILRIDVDPPPGAGPYQVPSTNPFVNEAGKSGEVVHYGLRSPRKLSFDRGGYAMWFSDSNPVSQEVNLDGMQVLYPSYKLQARNYGWPITDGIFCNISPCNPALYTPPVSSYYPGGAEGGSSIVGGYVYRGQRSFDLHGYYIFGDFASNRIFAMVSFGRFLLVDAPNVLQGISSFGEDEAGELYVASYGDGRIYAIDGRGPPMGSLYPHTAQRARPNFDGDARTDIAWESESAPGSYELWLMNGTAYTAASAGAPETEVRQIADYDGDGKTDVLWRNPDGSYRIDLMNGLSPGASALVLPGGYGWEVVGGGDFNADGKADLFWRNNRLFGVWLMNGTAFTSAALSIGAQDTLVALADFDGDGKTDVLSRGDNGATSITRMDGLAKVGTVDVYPGWNTWRPIAAADFDADGKADILWSTLNGNYGIWLMNGTSYTLSRVIRAGAPGWAGYVEPGWSAMTGLLRDFDNDGRADIVWLHTDGRVELWLMDAATQVKTVLPLIGAGTQWLPVAAGDYNGDGTNDLLWRDFSGQGNAGTRVMTNFSPPTFGTIAAPGVDWYVAP